MAIQDPKALIKYRNSMHVAELRAPTPILRENPELQEWQLELEKILDEPCLDDHNICDYC